MKMKNISKIKIEKNLKFFEIWKKLIDNCFFLKVAHDEASSLYPISRDEFRRTATQSNKYFFSTVKNTHAQESQYGSMNSVCWFTYLFIKLLL